MYRLEITRAAREQLERLPRQHVGRVERAIDGLAEQPRPAGCTKLAGRNETWRIRVGNYRVIYEIHDRRLLVIVIRVGHRKDVYRSK